MANFQPRDSSNSVAATRSGSRHQFKRSLSELASPARLSRHHPHQRRDRYHDDRAPSTSSAYLPSRTSVDMPRSEGVTPMMSPDQSRRPSVMAPDDIRLIHPSGLPESKTSKDGKQRDESARCSDRVDSLKQSLEQVNYVSTSAARRLDDTYFAVLEKMSSLRATVAALKDLAEMSRGVHESFRKESREIEDDITSQINSLGQFHQQQNSIESLQTRIKDGRTKIRSLSQRVEVVRERVERWDRLDKESQESTRKRLKAIWICMLIVFFATISLYIGASYLSSNLDAKPAPRVVESILESREDDGTQHLVSQSHDHSHGHVDAIGDFLQKRESDDGEALRIFDEL